MWTSDTIQARLKAYEDELPLFMRDYHLPGLSIAITGLDHGVGHFRSLSITQQRHMLAYHGIAMSHEGLCQVF